MTIIEETDRDAWDIMIMIPQQTSALSDSGDIRGYLGN